MSMISHGGDLLNAPRYHSKDLDNQAMVDVLQLVQFTKFVLPASVLKGTLKSAADSLQDYLIKVLPNCHKPLAE